MLDLDPSAAFDTVDLQSRQTVFCPRDVVSRLERLGLDVLVSRRSRDVPKVSSRSRLRQLCDVSVSVS
jgi:hypothetical protein